MGDPLISVHMVTYNHEPYIARAIEGVLLQQTTFPLELVIGEDCSSDGTRDIVFEYQKRYPDVIHVITSKHNVGASENGARIREACRGKYIAICDGDDYWTDPCKLQRQVDFLEAHPEYSICCHDVEVVCEGVPRVKRWADFTEDTFSFDDAVKGHFIPSVSVVCKRTLVAAMPEWTKECISGDIPMELLVLDQGLGYYIHETMGVKQDHPGGISRDPRRGRIKSESFLRMYKRLDVHTQGRHRRILRWQTAKIGLKIATNSLKARQYARSLRYCLDSLVCDRRVAWGVIKRKVLSRLDACFGGRNT